MFLYLDMKATAASPLSTPAALACVRHRLMALPQPDDDDLPAFSFAASGAAPSTNKLRSLAKSARWREDDNLEQMKMLMTSSPELC